MFMSLAEAALTTTGTALPKPSTLLLLGVDWWVRVFTDGVG
jgi:hypothetical protein